MGSLMNDHFYGDRLLEEQRRPGPISTKALRTLLGWTRPELARRAGISADAVRAIETDPVSLPVGWDRVREAVHEAFLAAGGKWWTPCLHQGARRVFLVPSLTTREANAREAITVGLILSGAGPDDLASHFPTAMADDLIAALRNGKTLTPTTASTALKILQKRAGCYFDEGARGGFTGVGAPAKAGFQ